MGSSRLPGKTMMPVHDGIPLLECVVRRFRACRKVDEVVVATTVEKEDDPIAEWCARNNVSVFRGSEEDVLNRVAGAVREYDADIVVQMGADSAYLDFRLIDLLVDHYRNGRFDYVCNDLKLTYPLGIYSHIVRAEKLIELDRRPDLSSKDRCDVVRYIWEHPEQYRISSIEAPATYCYPELRLTIDYPEDMEQARQIYTRFGDVLFTTEQVLELYRRHPEMFEKTKKLVQQSAPFLKK
jgi:spore coat polysaccharide biosynthesis protein SpsF